MRVASWCYQVTLQWRLSLHQAAVCALLRLYIAAATWYMPYIYVPLLFLCTVNFDCIVAIVYCMLVHVLKGVKRNCCVYVARVSCIIGCHSISLHLDVALINLLVIFRWLSWICYLCGLYLCECIILFLNSIHLINQSSKFAINLLLDWFCNYLKINTPQLQSPWLLAPPTPSYRSVPPRMRSWYLKCHRAKESQTSQPLLR